MTRGFCLALVVMMSASASAAAESWLQCDGTVAVTNADGKPGASMPAKDVYAYDDQTRHLFKYSDQRKTLDLVFVTSYGPDRIAWSNPIGASTGDLRWDGVLDRSAMTLKLVRKERGEVETWTETCKAIQPLG